MTLTKVAIGGRQVLQPCGGYGHFDLHIGPRKNISGETSGTVPLAQKLGEIPTVNTRMEKHICMSLKITVETLNAIGVFPKSISSKQF